jgi:endoglucanase
MKRGDERTFWTDGGVLQGRRALLGAVVLSVSVACAACASDPSGLGEAGDGTGSSGGVPGAGSGQTGDAGGGSNGGSSGGGTSGGSSSGGTSGGSSSGGTSGGSSSGGADSGGGGREGGGAPDGGSGAYRHLYGVNLAGADFGEDALPGTFGTDYTYPTHEEVDYYVGKGLTMFRVPFRWERLQRTLRGELDATELGRLQDIVGYALSKGAWVLIDPHNYARYQGSIVGDTGSNVSADDYADFWRRLAGAITDPHVVYGLMNEPNTMRTELWLADANAAIAAIRGAGAPNLVLVPGNAWTGGESWSSNFYGTPNADVMGGVVDPLQNYAIEIHQYLNADSSGGTTECTSATIGTERLAGFEAWARQHKVRAFLGEFGTGRNQTCYDALNDLLGSLRSKDDLWIGWTFWAGGPWWGDTETSLEPQNGVDDPRMPILRGHL